MGGGCPALDPGFRPVAQLPPARIQLYQDGVPLNVADGGGDFQLIDPTAYQYTEVYKGANALRFGANSLGGAINLVTPTGHDADLLEGRADVGSFGFRRLQASSGGVQGAVDGFVTGSWQAQEGFRDHSKGRAARASGNLGWRIAENVETRFYLSVADISQEIPGAVTKTMALTEPKTAARGNLQQDYQRNLSAVRVSNVTSIRLGGLETEVGAYYGRKHLLHPIFQYLDYRYHDYGAFARAVDERVLAGHGNRLTLGLTYTGGWVDNQQFVNLPGARKGNLLSSSKDRSDNLVAYAENSFDLRPDLALVLGLQYVDARRKRTDRLPAPPDTSGSNDNTFLNPKLGLLWQAGPDWQVFGNVSRSGEAPTFSELNFTNAALADLKPQKATTVEIGTRGRQGEVEWDLALYRAQIRNEFQFFDLGGGNYQVTNADRTIHQGAELGLGWRFWKGIFQPGTDPDGLRLQGAYTFSDFRFDGDPVWGNNQLPGAPRHYVRAELMYESPKGFRLGPNVEWVPEAYYVDNANTLRTANYALLGFRAGYDLGEHLSLYLDARNLTDARYIASSSVAAVATQNSALFEPGNGRAFFAGLRATW